MKFSIFKSFFIAFSLLWVVSLQAQSSMYTIRGQVMEASTNQPLEFATVSLVEKSTEKALTGVTTDENGIFEIKSNVKNFHIEISFIGLQSKIVEKFDFSSQTVSVGKVYLQSDQKQLDEVVVTADKSTTEFKLDKRVFNVGQDLSSSGASALDVLNNVPSVNVDIEGVISLRGSSGVQILINGKPSVLASEQGNALGTITSDMIEAVEVITNPSAKYEAEGTSGIINIILKKEEKRGTNGSISLNTGIPHNHSLGFSLNHRTDKWNIFTQGGVGYRELPRYIEVENRDLSDNSAILTDGVEYRNENFYNISLGTDYYLTPQDVFTLSGSFAYEIEDQPSNTDFQSINSDGEIDRRWERVEVTEATNPKLQYEFQYKRDFLDHEDHDLLFVAIGNYFGKEQSSEFTNIPIEGDLDLSDQTTATNFEEGKYTFKLDYIKPFRDRWTFETGAQYLLNNVGNDYVVRNFENDEFVVDPSLTNNFEYTQNVLGVYATGAYEGDIWGLKAGLRVENTELNTLLVDTNESNDRNFTNFFPSAHTSFKLQENLSFQAGYSRRIFRPRLWDLNPFFNIRNNFSIRTGNPDLLPEFTDSYEMGAIYIIGNFSNNLNVFHRYTTNQIERVAIIENNISTFKPYNVGTSNSTGAEYNFKYTPFKKWTFTGDGNYNLFNKQGEFEDNTFDFEGSSWEVDLTTKFKPNKIWEFEISGEYESKRPTIQGVQLPSYFLDFGMRYKIMEGKGVFNLGVRDIFATRVELSESFQNNYFVYNRRQRGRFVTLGFSYGFGKGEAMEYSGRRR